MNTKKGNIVGALKNIKVILLDKLKNNGHSLSYVDDDNIRAALDQAYAVGRDEYVIRPERRKRERRLKQM